MEGRRGPGGRRPAALRRRPDARQPGRNRNVGQVRNHDPRAGHGADGDGGQQANASKHRDMSAGRLQKE